MHIDHARTVEIVQRAPALFLLRQVEVDAALEAERSQAHHGILGVGLDEAGTAGSGSKRPEQWIICNERFKLLNNALAQLPYQPQLILVLFL